MGLHTAARIIAVAILLTAGGTVPVVSADAGDRPGGDPAVDLHTAALEGDIHAVRQYIESGADLDAKDAYGSTPLIVAVTFGRDEVATALIRAGADPTIANNDGSTALHLAAFFCRTPVVRLLLDRDVNRYLRNDAGLTALDLVTVPFEKVKGTYDRITEALGPLGLQLDYQRIRETRPRIASMLRPGPQALRAVDYAPRSDGAWQTSTPAQQGLDPTALSEMYLSATGLPTLYGLLVVRHGRLVAEKYFNRGSVDQLSGRQSATKSVTSALVGIALDRGCLKSVDQRMLAFFPELADQVTDPRKRQVTIRQLLQMRAGYPWEEREPPYFDMLFRNDDWHWLPHVVDFPLTSDPGTTFKYSNLTSHLLGVIVARACRTDLQTFARDRLFAPIGAELPRWRRDADGYNWGWGESYITARDMARFGLLYLNGGMFDGRRVLAAAWVKDSLRRYSEGINFTGIGTSEAGRYLHDIGYGYQWWSARVGPHRIDFAWGHGGNLVVLLKDLDMVIVTTADPLYHLPSGEGWRYEGAIVDLVGQYIESLPTR